MLDLKCLAEFIQLHAIHYLNHSLSYLYTRYVGHKNDSYKIDAVVSSSDRHVLCGSEDGKAIVWDLVEVILAQRIAFIFGLK